MPPTSLIDNLSLTFPTCKDNNHTDMAALQASLSYLMAYLTSRISFYITQITTYLAQPYPSEVAKVMKPAQLLHPVLAKLSWML